jgi:hypothetical protein
MKVGFVKRDRTLLTRILSHRFAGAIHIVSKEPQPHGFTFLLLDLRVPSSPLFLCDKNVSY